MISSGDLLHARILTSLLAGISCTPALACDLIPPKRQPTVAEQVAGLKTIFGGTVVGWEITSGKKLMGQMPSACLEDGKYYWYADPMPTKCEVYLGTSAALFRVDTPIVGPEAGAIIPVYMTWGDGDCNNDYNLGEQWFIAGDEIDGQIQTNLLSYVATQELEEPIRAEEIAALRTLAAKPKFDFHTLYK